MSRTIRKYLLAVSAAALAVGIAGVQSWAEMSSDGEGPRRLQLAQAAAGSEAKAGEDEEEIPELSDEVLEDPEMIAAGEVVWQEQCRHCHGRSAYPGKAPKLRPSRYRPEFVYHRVTYGFRGMPAWEEVYSEEERIAVTAYVLSREFSP